MTDEEKALLHRLAADVARLSAEVAQLRRRRVQADPETIARLMQAIAFLWDGNFLAAELRDHAELPEAADLRAALVAAVGSIAPKKIGKFFGNIKGRDFGGLAIHRLTSKARKGALWQVVDATGDCETRQPRSHGPRLGEKFPRPLIEEQTK